MRNIVRAVLGAAILVLIALLLVRQLSSPERTDVVSMTEPSASSASQAPVVLASPTPTTASVPVASTSPSPEPVSKPAPSAAPKPPPAPSGPKFVSFGANPRSISCSPTSEGPYSPGQTVDVQISWATTDADQAWIGAATADAESAPYASVPSSGSFTITLVCPAQAASSWTVTAKGPNGKVSKTVVIANTGYQGG